MRKEDIINSEFYSKKWGFEKLLTKSNKYCGIYQFIAKDVSLPFHYFKTQDRTIHLHSGKVKMYFTDDVRNLKLKIAEHGIFGVYSIMEVVTLHKGDGFYIPPQRVCQIIPSEDSEIYIFATEIIQGDYCEIH